MLITTEQPKLYVGAKIDYQLCESLKEQKLVYPNVKKIIWFSFVNEFKNIGALPLGKIYIEVYPWMIENKDTVEEEEALYLRSKETYKKQFKGFPEVQPLEFLIYLNEFEYEKLNTCIESLEHKISKIDQKDDAGKEAFNTIIKRLKELKIGFIDWFYKNRGEIPKTERSESFDDVLSLNPYQIEDLDSTIQGQIKYFVMTARKDEREGAQEKWKNKILKDFRRSAPLGVIKRIMVKFNEKYPKEKFNINGMAWYKQAKKHSP